MGKFSSSLYWQKKDRAETLCTVNPYPPLVKGTVSLSLRNPHPD